VEQPSKDPVVFKRYGIFASYILILVGCYYFLWFLAWLIFFIFPETPIDLMNYVFWVSLLIFFIVVLFSIFHKKFRNYLFDKGEFLVNAWPGVFRFLWAQFKSETATEVAERHSRRKQARIERRKYMKKK